MKKYIALLILLSFLLIICCSANADTWELVPLRSSAQRTAGLALGLSASQTGGEATQMPFHLATDPSDANNLYVSIDTCSPWRSTNGGISWQFIPMGHTTNGAACISVKTTDSNTLLMAGSSMEYTNRYVSTYETGVFKSTNKGDTWTKVHATMRFNRNTLCKNTEAFSWNGNTVYALEHKVASASTTQTIYKSTDSGSTWSSWTTIPAEIYGIVKPTGTTTMYGGGSPGLYRINPDNGATTLILSKPIRKMVVHPTDANTAYVAVYATADNGVWKTTNLSAATPTWAKKTTGINAAHTGTTPMCFEIAISPVDGNRLYLRYEVYATTDPTPMYYSSDGATTWVAVDISPTNNYNVGNLAAIFPGIDTHMSTGGMISPDTGTALKAFCTEIMPGSIRMTADGGQTWTYRGHGISGFTGYGYSHVPSFHSQFGFDTANADLVSNVSGDFGVINCSNFTTDATWAQASKPPKYPASGGENRAQAVARRGNTIVCAQGKAGNEATLVTSVDAGNSWFPLDADSTRVAYTYSLIEFDSNNENLIYAGYFRGTRGSNLQNFTWSTALARFVDHVWKRAGYDYLYSYVTGDKLIRKSEDKGVTWLTPYTVFPGTGTVKGMTVSPTNENLIYLLTYGSAGQGGVWKLTGTPPGTWARKTAGITLDTAGNYSYQAIAIDPLNANNLYIGSYVAGSLYKGVGMHKSADAGESWTNISGNTGKLMTVTMRVNPHTGIIYNGSHAGTWRVTSGADTTNPVINITVPTTQNYFGTTTATVTVSGSASDAGGFGAITYSLTGATTASGSAAGTTAWAINNLALNIGTSTLTVTATDAASNVATDSVVLERTTEEIVSPVPDLVFPHTDETMVIDGNLTELSWEGATANFLTQEIQGVKSGTGSVKGLWDANYLYIGFIGTDTAKNRNPSGTTNAYLYTGVQVYLDSEDDGGFYGPYDFNWTLPWNQGNWFEEAAGKITGVLMAVGTVTNGYTVEMAIPWTLMGIVGTNSTSIGIDVQQNFNTDADATREGAIDMYNYLDTNYLNTDNFGVAILGTQTQAGGGAGSSTVTKITDYIAEWKFDETTGSATAERIGAIPTTIYGTGAVTRSAGRYGNTFQPFPGSSTIIVGSSSVMANIGTSTIVAIIRPTSDSGAIFDRNTDSGGAGFYRFELSAPYALWHYKDMTTTDLNILSANSVLTVNQWQTVARTWNGGSSTAGTQFYVDGNLVSQGATTAGVGNNVNDGGLNTSIANRHNGSNPFSGKIDNLAIFSRVLTATELLDCAAWVQGTTSTALDITSLTASLYGSVSISFGTTAVVACFDYGTETGSYLAGSTTAQNTGRTTVGVSDVIHTISGLTPGTTYYYRLRVESPAYTVYGAESSFATSAADITAPTIGINYPTSAANYQTSSSLPLLVTGTSSDNVAVTQVVWVNETIGTSGVCVGTTQWNVQELPIQEGTNTCKFTAFDASNNQGTATINIYRNLDTPVTEITSPSANCTFSDGNPAYGTTGTSISLAGVAVDNYNGITQVTISNGNTSTVNTATGTSSWSYTQRILAQLDDGLVFRAALDEANGVTQIKDSSRYGITGTNTGAVGTTTSKFGRSRYFDGFDDKINFGTAAQFQIGTSNASFCFWVKIGTTTTKAMRYICHRDNTSGIGYEVYNEGEADTLSLYLRDDTGGHSIYTTSVTTRNLAWHYIAISVARDSNALFYLDGVQIGTHTVSPDQNGNLNNTQPLALGVAKDLASTPLLGTLDEVRIYNKALSQAEITQLYQLTSPDQDNIIRATGHDVILNQGTDTIHIGAFPTTTTSDATNVSYHSAQLNGTVNPNNNETTVWFDYGLSSGAYTGSSSAQVVTGDADTAIRISLGALNKGTEYFCRLVGSGTVGLTYGNEYSFTTLAGYTLEEVTGISSPLSWSTMGSTKFRVGLKAYGIYNPWTRWRSTADKQRLIDDTDNEITQAIEDL